MTLLSFEGATLFKDFVNRGYKELNSAVLEINSKTKDIEVDQLVVTFLSGVNRYFDKEILQKNLDKIDVLSNDPVSYFMQRSAFCVQQKK